MSWNMDFLRFDRSSKEEGFVYTSTDNPKNLEHEFNTISMGKLGFNINIQIQNYMIEPVLLGGNLRAGPTRIRSLIRENSRPRDEVSDHVLITIYSSENNASADPKKRTTLARKTEIRIPGRMLNKGSVFVSELDCYLMTESQLDATRELIANDVTPQASNSINVPSSFAKQEPETTYHQYKKLAKYCIERQDKISIRVGVDLQYDKIPDIIKTLRIGILDSYFVPYDCYKLVYDPTLSEDEFVIENLHLASTESFTGSFEELKRLGTRYLVHDEYDTMFGKFYGLAIFANEQRYVDYVHQRRSQERFHEEGVFLANRSGDPLLKEEISKLQREVVFLTDQITEQTTTNETLQGINKKLKGDLKERDNTIDKIRQNYDTKMSAEVVLSDIANDTQKIVNENRKIDLERIDLDHRVAAAPALHKANVLKNIADMMKSTWGIITAILGGILGIAALCKKYNVKISMAT